MKDKNYYWLDLIRFIAAFIVLLVHARTSSFVDYGELTNKNIIITLMYIITRLGNEAVLVFFVLSGFFVFGKVIEKIALNEFNPTTYLIDRTVRILVPLIPALGMTVLVNVIMNVKINWLIFTGNIFALQGVVCQRFGGNAPLWSLAYEVWFYVLALIVALFLITKNNRLMILLAFVLIFIIFTKLNPVYLFCWLIGGIAYATKPASLSYGVLTFSILLLLYSLLGTQIGSESVSLNFSESFKALLLNLDASRITLSLSFALLIQQIILLRPRKAIFKQINKLGSLLAASSYTLYLTHYPILHLFSYLGFERANNINITSCAYFIFKVISCLLMSYIMWYFFERHTNRIKKIVNMKLNVNSKKMVVKTNG